MEGILGFSEEMFGDDLGDCGLYLSEGKTGVKEDTLPELHSCSVDLDSVVGEIDDYIGEGNNDDAESTIKSTQSVLRNIDEFLGVETESIVSTQSVLRHINKFLGEDTDDNRAECEQHGGGVENELPHVQVMEETEREYKRFKTNGRVLRARLRESPLDVNPIVWVKEGLQELLNYLLRDANPNDQIGLTIRNIDQPDKPFWMSFRPANNISMEVIWTSLERVLQSNASFLSDDSFYVFFHHVKMPHGEGRTSQQKRGSLPYHELVKRNNGIVSVKNKDSKCLAHAIVVARGMKNNDSKERKRYHNQRQYLMAKEVRELCENAGVDLSAGGGITEIEKFQQYLTGYQIVVYGDLTGNNVLYEGPEDDNRILINLVLHNNHYDVITSLTAAFAANYYCSKCHVKYFHQSEHVGKCLAVCPRCKCKPPCNQVSVGQEKNPIKCNDCNRTFFNQQCFDNHQTLRQNKPRLCDTLKCCTFCFKVYPIRKNRRMHTCGEKYCSMCKRVCPANHLCYIQKKPMSTKDIKETKKAMFVFYDIESRQDMDASGVQTHVPNLLVSQNVCYTCLNDDDMSRSCDVCGDRQHIFSGKDPVEKFLNTIVEYRAKVGNIVCIAHNAKGYDAHFLLRCMMEKKGGHQK